MPGIVVDFGHDRQIAAFVIMDASKFTDLSQVKVFMSRWGDTDKVLDSGGALTEVPRAAKTIHAGD